MKGTLSKVAWAALAALGAFCLGTVALRPTRSGIVDWAAHADNGIHRDT